MWDHKLHTLRRQRLFDEDTARIGGSQDERDARDLASQLIIEGSAFRRWDDVFSLLARIAPGTTWQLSQKTLSAILDARSIDLPSLPSRYGFKGGGARHALAALLGRRGETPRDIDLVRLGRRWTPLDTELSGRYMREDFLRGNGVELIRSFDRYFATRDLSVNEVIHIDGAVHATPLAVLDTAGYVLRPCRYLPGTLRRPPALFGRTLLKMLRLRAEGLIRGEPWMLVGVPERIQLEDFHVALELSRALERSTDVARIFAESLVTLGLLEPGSDGDSLSMLIDELAHLLDEIEGGAQSI